jgi:hypothetical protein
MFPSAATTNCQPFSSDLGSIVIDGSSGCASLFASTGTMQLVGADAVGRVVGLLQNVTSTATTDPGVFVIPLKAGDNLLIDYSTVYAGSTANVIATTSIGQYLKLCKTTGSTTYGTPALQATLAKYIDPSTSADVPGSTTGSFVFQLKDFSTRTKRVLVSFVPLTTAAAVYQNAL